MEPEVDAAILRAWLSGESIGREGAMNIPSLAGCLNKIAGTMAAVPIKLYKREDDRITEVTDDRRTILLNSETGDTLDAYQMKRAVVLDWSTPDMTHSQEHWEGCGGRSRLMSCSR